MRRSTVIHRQGKDAVARAEVGIPAISPTLLRFFARYSEAYLRRHFHSVRLLRTGTPQVSESLPLIVYLNHSSWWDPLLCLLLAQRFFPERKSFAPIEAKSLRRYPFFRRLGFFGAENNLAGAARFLRITDRILARSDHALWITPQGNFVDHRARPLRFQGGLSHIANRAERAAFVPLALEIVYWEERLPEALISFGAPLVFGAERKLTITETTQLFESAMTVVQDELSAASQRRQPDDWRVLVQGRAGVGRVYDFWRRAKAKVRGEKFSAAHSDL